MAAREGGSSSNTLLAFAVGALVGAAVALLYAPASGEETRRAIRRKARAGKDRLSDLRDTVESAVEHGREAFEDARREPFGGTSKEKL